MLGRSLERLRGLVDLGIVSGGYAGGLLAAAAVLAVATRVCAVTKRGAAPS